MNEKRTSVFSNGLIWFGAGVSLAEILTRAELYHALKNNNKSVEF